MSFATVGKGCFYNLFSPLSRVLGVVGTDVPPLFFLNAQGIILVFGGELRAINPQPMPGYVAVPFILHLCREGEAVYARIFLRLAGSGRGGCEL